MDRRDARTARVPQVQDAAVAVVASQSLRAQLAVAARGVATLFWCESLAQTRTALATCGGCVVVIGVDTLRHARVTDVVHHLTRDVPGLSIVLLVPLQRITPNEFVALGAAGVTTVVDPGDGNLRRVMAELLRSQSLAAHVRRNARDVCGALNPPLREIVDDILSHGVRCFDVGEYANARGLSRSTLARRLFKGTSMTPRRLIGWGRLLALLTCLERAAITIERAANELDFPSPNACRNLAKRYTHLTIGALRQSGGSRRVMDLLSAEIAAHAQRRARA